MKTRLTRVTDGSTLVAEVLVCDTFWSRLRGLMGRKSLDASIGCFFPRCRAIHTIGMSFSIDIVFLDENLAVCEVVRALPPWRVTTCRSADSVLELTSGAAEVLGFYVGLKTRFEPAPGNQNGKT